MHKIPSLNILRWAMASCLAIAPLCAAAQSDTEGEYAYIEKSKPAVSLKGETVIGLVIDFSETKIDGKSQEVWLLRRQADRPQDDPKKELEEELKPVVRNLILANTNLALMKHSARLVENAEGCRYTLVYKPIVIDEDGDNKGTCTIMEDGNEVYSFKVSGGGGHVGSMANLWGDGYKSTSKKIAKKMASLFK